jgi:cyclohexyl-isocyanide hydratase
MSPTRTACHWAWRELLPLFGAIVDEGRVVRDGNILSGGGVTAGIDFVLALIAELRGPRPRRSASTCPRPCSPAPTR